MKTIRQCSNCKYKAIINSDKKDLTCHKCKIGKLEIIANIKFQESKR